MTEKSRAARIEIFSQAIVSGKTQSDAYRLAYPSSLKWKDVTLHPRASEMAKDHKVVTRVQELRRELEKEHSWSRSESVKWLAKLVRNEKKNDTVRHASIKTLNDMFGNNSPVKLDHTSSDGSMSSRPFVDVKKLSEGARKEVLDLMDAEENEDE